MKDFKNIGQHRTFKYQKCDINNWWETNGGQLASQTSKGSVLASGFSVSLAILANGNVWALEDQKKII